MTTLKNEIEKSFSIKDIKMSSEVQKVLNWNVISHKDLLFSSFRYRVYTLQSPKNPINKKSIVLENNGKEGVRLILN